MIKNMAISLHDQKKDWLAGSVIFIFIALIAGFFIPKLGLYGDQWRTVLDQNFILSGYPAGKLISSLLVKLIGANEIYFHLLNAILMVVDGLILYRLQIHIKFEPSTALAGTLLFLVFPGFGQPGAAFELSVILVGLLFSLFSIDLYLVSQKMEAKTELRYFIPGIAFAFLAFMTSPVIAVFEGLSILGLCIYLWLIGNKQPIWILFFGASHLIVSLIVLTLFTHLPGKISLSLIMSSIKTWMEVFLISWRKVIAMPSGGGLVAVYLLVLVVISGSLVYVFYILSGNRKSNETISTRDFWILLGTAITGVILFIIPGIFQIPIGLEFPTNIEIFVVGIPAAIFMATLIKTVFLDNYQMVILAVLIALSGGARYQTTQRFVDETNRVENFISQIQVRGDTFQLGTSLIVEQLPFDFTSRISLEALLRNRMNLPQNGKTIQVITADNAVVREYLSNSDLEPISLTIDGSDYFIQKNLMLAMWQPMNGCLFLLEPEMTYGELPEGLGLAVKFSNPDLIKINHLSDVKQLNQFRTTINPEWCFDFQLANRQEQNGQWENAINSYTQIVEDDIQSERLAILKPLLISYLHSQRFSEAILLTEEFSGDAQSKKIVCQQWTTYLEEKDIPKEVLTEARKAQLSAGCN